MSQLEDNVAPNLALLESVENEMARVSATLHELNRDDVDPAALVAWVPADTGSDDAELGGTGLGGTGSDDAAWGNSGP